MTDRHSDDRTSGGEPVSAFEQRLREGLHTSASSVQPAPDGWRRVQARLRRRRTLQVGGFAVAGAAAVLTGVLVLGNVPETAITFDPGVGDSSNDLPTSSPSVLSGETAQAAAGNSADAAAVVYADAEGVHMADLDGRSIATDLIDLELPVTNIAVRPGSTPREVVLVVRTEDADGCGQLWWTTVGVGVDTPSQTDTDPSVEVYGTESVPMDPDSTACAGAPVFASDGSALAWLANPEGPGQASPQVRAVSWPGRFPEGSIRTADASLPGASPEAVEWLVFPGEVRGTLHVRMFGPDGDAAVQAVGIVLDGDTFAVDRTPVLIGLAARGIPRVLDLDDGWAVGSDNPIAATDRRPLGWSLTTLSADVSPSSTSELTWAPGDPLFLDALGNTAVIGTGDTTITTTRAADGEEVRFGLPPAASAALLGHEQPETAPTSEDAPIPGPAPTPTPSTAPPTPATATPTPPVTTAEAAPGTVLDAAAAIRTAALAEDWEALRALVPADGFTASFGGTDDPIAYYQQLQAEGTDVLGILAGLLDGPAAAVPETDLWAWPREFVESDGYYDWRVGITADGTWRYFVAGD